MTPNSVSNILDGISKAILSSNHPSKSIVLRDLKLLLSGLSGERSASIHLSVKFLQPEITTFPGDMVLTRKPGKSTSFDTNKIKNELSYMLKGSGAEIIEFTQNEIVIHALDMSSFRVVEVIFDNLEKGLYPSKELQKIFGEFELTDFISRRKKKPKEQVEDIRFPQERDPHSYWYGSDKKGYK